MVIYTNLNDRAPFIRNLFISVTVRGLLVPCQLPDALARMTALPSNVRLRGSPRDVGITSLTKGNITALLNDQDMV